MKVLITGGAGFVGSNLTKKLLEEKNEIFVVDNFSTGNKKNIKEFLQNKNYSFWESSIEQSEFLQKCENQKKKFDLIFHLACPTGVPNIETLGEEMIDACSIGTKNVLKVASLHNAKFVFSSSSEIYGEPLVVPQSEEYGGNVDPQGFRASYEEGKRFSEALVHLFVQKYGVNATTLRFFNIYGTNMDIKETRVIPRFISQALSGEDLTVHGQGLQKRTMCFVDDLVDGLILVSKKGAKGGIYNIGSNLEITMLDLAKKVIELTNSNSKISFVERAAHDHSSRMPDLSKIHSLGWSQKISLDEGILRTVADFKRRIEKEKGDIDKSEREKNEFNNLSLTQGA